MAQVFGNDGGGFWIGPDGKIHRIPPWEPALLRQLRAVAALTNAAPQLPGRVAKQLIPLTTKLAGLVVVQVENVVGEISGEHGLVFDDVEGGFTCGSTGKPPIPIPPRHFAPSVSQLLASQLLDVQRLPLGDSGALQVAERLEV